MLLYMKIFRKLRNFSRIHCQTQNRQQAVDDFKMLFLIHENYINATACILWATATSPMISFTRSRVIRDTKNIFTTNKTIP